MKPVVFVKYTNRKLYCTETSEYVSMVQLSDVVASGKRVRVLLDSDGSDVTTRTLCRALYERHKFADDEATTLEAGDVEALIRKIKTKE